MVVSSLGYYGTGSSAIADYIHEFSGVCNFGQYEFRFLHDIDGVSDLEYHLVENYNRHNSGHALKRYKRFVDFYSGNKLVPKYEMFFKGNFKKFSYEYIENLTYYKFKGYWHEDLRDKGWNFFFIKRLQSKILNRFKNFHFNEMPNEITYGTMINEEEF